MSNRRTQGGRRVPHELDEIPVEEDCCRIGEPFGLGPCELEAFTFRASRPPEAAPLLKRLERAPACESVERDAVEIAAELARLREGPPYDVGCDGGSRTTRKTKSWTPST